MQTDESIHVYGALSGDDIGIILTLPADSTVRNPEGQVVPGIVMSPAEARELCRQIMWQIEQMEQRG